MVLKPVWRYTSVPVGQAGLPIPRKLLIPLPDSLSLPTFPTEHLFKKKKILRKKGRKATTASGLQIQQAKYTASTGGKGPPPHWPVSNQSLIYIVHKSCALHKQNEAPSPETTMSTPACPQPGVGRGQVRQGRERQRLMRVSVWETKAEASREI